jgi:hypothetical protein
VGIQMIWNTWQQTTPTPPTSISAFGLSLAMPLLSYCFLSALLFSAQPQWLLLGKQFTSIPPNRVFWATPVCVKTQCPPDNRSIFLRRCLEHPIPVGALFESHPLLTSPHTHPEACQCIFFWASLGNSNEEFWWIKFSLLCYRGNGQY